MKYSPTYKSFGDSALLIEWPHEMSEAIINDIISFNKLILREHHFDILETIQSINSITVICDLALTSLNDLSKSLQLLYAKQPDIHTSIKSNLWKVPVCYEGIFGLDLQIVADHSGLCIGEIIDCHASTIYQVYSIGFLPGFLYLGGLDKRLHVSRKSKPRLEILKGSVGIGGSQTGIYPSISPGGWQIIGNSPVPLFDIAKVNPCFAQPGDKIQFVPISIDEHNALRTLTSKGKYNLEKEVLYD